MQTESPEARIYLTFAKQTSTCCLRPIETCVIPCFMIPDEQSREKFPTGSRTGAWGSEAFIQ